MHHLELSTEEQTRILQSLEALGDTSEAVADNLRQMGIQGGYGCNVCPIAKYLEIKFPAYSNYFRVHYNGTLDVSRFTYIDRVYDYFITKLGKMPAPVREFVHLYDIGRFSFLQEPAYL